MARINNEGKVVDDGCFKDLVQDQESTFDSKKFLNEIEDWGKQNGWFIDDYKCPQNISHVCPNCGYCPTCGRRTWPQRYPWYEPIWVVTNNSYTSC